MFDEPKYCRGDFCQDMVMPTNIEKVAMKVTETLQQPQLSRHATSARVSINGNKFVSHTEHAVRGRPCKVPRAKEPSKMRPENLRQKP